MNIAMLWLVALAAAKTPTDFARVPLTINIGLLGFAADGAWQVELDAAELYNLMRQLLPEREPRCGAYHGRTDVVYDLHYNVVQM